MAKSLRNLVQELKFTKTYITSFVTKQFGDYFQACSVRAHSVKIRVRDTSTAYYTVISNLNVRTLFRSLFNYLESEQKI